MGLAGHDTDPRQVIDEFRQQMNALSGADLDELEGLADDARGTALDADAQLRLGDLALRVLSQWRAMRADVLDVVQWLVARREEE